jgi:hypothetical protein
MESHDVLVRRELVRDINTADIIEEVYPKGSKIIEGSHPKGTRLPVGLLDFNPFDDVDPNWYRLREANDGDCLYWCILQVLADYNLHQEIQNISDLRMHLYRAITADPTLVHTYHDRAQVLRGLKNGIREPMEFDNWGNEQHFLALANLFNLNLYIFSVDEFAWNLNTPTNPNDYTINVFLEMNAGHYNILLPKSDKFRNINPRDDDYFIIVDKVELIPEVKKFKAATNIQSVKEAWDFFKKYRFRNHDIATAAYNARQFLPPDELESMYADNPPYTPRQLPTTPHTTRASTTSNTLTFPDSDQVHSAGGKLKTRTSKKKKLQRRKSRKNL